MHPLAQKLLSRAEPASARSLPPGLGFAVPGAAFLADLAAIVGSLGGQTGGAALRPWVLRCRPIPAPCRLALIGGLEAQR